MPKDLFFYDAADDVASGQPTNPSQEKSAPEIDYDKLASVVQGKQNVVEDTVLRNYFKQQGLTGEEMAQAITTFKEKKAAATPDVNVLQQELKKAQDVATRATLERNVQMTAIRQGVQANNLPYVLRLADLSNLTLESKDEEVEAVIAKVLEDVPALKADTTETKGFQQVGSTGQVQAITQQDAINKAFGL